MGEWYKLMVVDCGKQILYLTCDINILCFFYVRAVLAC